jgi:hypothetical protein
MEFSTSYSNALATLSYRAPINTHDSIIPTTGMCNKFIELDLSNNNFEVPIILRGYIDQIRLSEYNKIIISGCVNDNYTIQASGIETIIKRLYRIIGPKIIKMEYKDFTYYGTAGWILDKDFNTMFLITIEGNINNNNITYSGYNIYINPTVFTNNKDPMCKHIVSKLLPYYIEKGIPYIRSLCTYAETFNKNIIIGNPKVYLKSVNKPNSNEISKTINKLIKDNKDMIIDSFLT